MAQPNRTHQYSPTLLSWLKTQLNILIGADDFAPLLLSMDNHELQDYCNNLLGCSPATQSFINELIAKRSQEVSNKQNHPQNPPQKKKPTRRGGKKHKSITNDPNKCMSLDPNQYNISKKRSRAPNAVKKQPITTASTNYRPSGGSMTITHAPISKKSSRSHRKQKKKKRNVCGCQATLHDVFKNCTECGNILCMLEGEGPCFYCSAFVTLAGSIPSVQNATDTFDHQKSESYQKAVAQKEKLLRFGREKIAQTTIIDDQGDFYETEANNLWLTARERDIAKQKAMEHEQKINESRADRNIEISIQFGGNSNTARISEIEDTTKRYVFESIDREKQLKHRMNEADNNNNNNIKSSWYHNSSLTGHASKVYASLQKMIDSEREAKHDKNPKPKKEGQEAQAVDTLKEQFIEEANSDDDSERKMKQKGEDKKTELAVQYLSKKQQSKNMRKKLKKKSKYSDKSDCGVCLSMHQPWASLLVLGIKKVEGRSWFTSYRGRLWIASARREPTPFEIEEVEEQYIQVYGLKREEIPFPKEYPTTALLGCVDMVDCLTNEEYNKQYIQRGISNENNASAHCFICENPRRLILPGAISGEHKLWKMPQERIKPMQSGLVPCDGSWIHEPVRHANNDNDIDDEMLQQVIAHSLQQQ